MSGGERLGTRQSLLLDFWVCLGRHLLGVLAYSSELARQGALYPVPGGTFGFRELAPVGLTVYEKQPEREER